MKGISTIFITSAGGTRVDAMGRGGGRSGARRGHSMVIPECRYGHNTAVTWEGEESVSGEGDKDDHSFRRERDFQP